MTRFSLLIFFIFVIYSCGKTSDRQHISASACFAEINGEVVECKVGKDHMEKFEKAIEFYEQLDKDHPWPKYFANKDSSAVLAILNNANLILENGTELAFAGMECDPSKLLPYLTAIFLDEEFTNVSYLSTGYSEGGIEFAYVWEMPGPESSNKRAIPNNGAIPSWDAVNEIAVSNKWCYPIEQPNHKYHERFLKHVKFREE